jgi:TRAP-type transport system periplasmic protein
MRRGVQYRYNEYRSTEALRGISIVARRTNDRDVCQKGAQKRRKAMNTLRGVLSGIAGLVLALQIGAASATELVYGSWPPAGEYLNRVALPKAFAGIAKETNGAITWKLVPGGQLADPKATYQAAAEGLIQAGLGISTYVPNLTPSLTAIYSTVVFGNDVVAATGAALETVTLHCPSCLAEFKKANLVPLSGWTTSAYLLACREPVKSMGDLKGKRVRGTGGSAALLSMAGAVPIAATLPEAVNLLQRGGMDCQFGVNSWLKVFGYADFAKYLTDYPLGITGPAIGLMMNRDTWNKFTPEQKKIHMKYAGQISASLAIGQFVDENEAVLDELIKDKGVQVVHVSDPQEFAALSEKFDKAQREKNVADAKNFGVADPGAVLDAYAADLKKWSGLSKGIGRDIDKFTDAIWTEIYSKVDPEKL